MYKELNKIVLKAVQFMLNTVMVDPYTFASGSKASEIPRTLNNPIVPIKSKQPLQPSLPSDSPSDSHLPSSESS